MKNFHRISFEQSQRVLQPQLFNEKWAPEHSRELPEELDLESVERFITNLGNLDDDEVERLLQKIAKQEEALS